MRIKNYYFILFFLILFPFAVSGQYTTSPKLPEGVLSPGQVSKSQVGQILTVQGLVVKFEPTWNERYPNSLYLRDTAGNTLHVVYWKNVEDAIGSERVPKPGQLLRVKGQINEFRGEINLSITAPEDIVDAGSDVEEKVPTMPLNTITKDKLNQVVKIQGQVVNIRPSWKPTAPDIITLSDGGDSMVSVVYWSDVKERLQAKDIPELGKILLIEGWVDVYREQIQVKVDNPYKIKCVGETPLPSSSNGSAVAAPAVSTPQVTQVASANPSALSNPSQANKSAPFGYSNPFVPSQNAQSPQKQTTNTPGTNPQVNSQVNPQGTPSQSVSNQSGQPASDFPVSRPPLVQDSQPQTPKGPGFYTIDKAPQIIKGPPSRPHVLFFTSQDQDPYSKDLQFQELSAKAVFVWIDIFESAHIASQLKVTVDPTWIYYDANGFEKARDTGNLTTVQLAHRLALIAR